MLEVQPKKGKKGILMDKTEMAYQDFSEKAIQLGTLCARQIQTDVYNGRDRDDAYELEACHIAVAFKNKLEQGLFRNQEYIPLYQISSQIHKLSGHPAAQTVYERLVGLL